jgi:catechol 2,3-dioxygenase-like lactoylglutathione lyase family enzyme
MSKPKFAHNVFQTAQPEAMRDWYCTVLDAHVVYEDATLTFLTFDDEHHRVALLHPPIPMQAKTATTAALHHSAYTFDSIDASATSKARHRSWPAGVTPSPGRAPTSRLPRITGARWPTSTTNWPAKPSGSLPSPAGTSTMTIPTRISRSTA